MIKIEIEITPEEAELLYNIMERSTDKSDFRERWKSDELKRLEAKVRGAIVIAQQKAL